jgi:predicted RNase H-like HicB family nuclease
MANYIAIVHKEDKSDFGVSFSDFPGCITAGKNIDEAKDMAQEALTLHIQGMSKTANHCQSLPGLKKS